MSEKISQETKDADLVRRAAKVSREKNVRIDEDVEGALAREHRRLVQRLDREAHRLRKRLDALEESK